MADKEINIFAQKLKRNPYRMVMLFTFVMKLSGDIFKKRFFRKRKNKIHIPIFNNNIAYTYTPLDFINCTVLFNDIIHYHFPDKTAIDRLDDQFVHYTERFYELPFTNANEIGERITNIKNWVVNNPVGRTVGWHPYAVSERIVNWSIFLSRFSKELDNEQKKSVLRSLYEHSEFLFNNIEYHLGHHNHLINHSRALLYSCGIFRNEPFTFKWKKNAFDIINKELKFQVLEDGVHAEQSSTYHLLLTRTLWELRELYVILNEPFEYGSMLKKMVFYAKWLIRSDGSVPFTGHITPDWHWKELIGLSSLWVKNSPIQSSGYAHLFKPNYCIDYETDESSIVIFSHSGIGIIKNRGIEIHFSNDPRCEITSHGDQNMLGTDISWDGTHLIWDGGLDSYNLNQNRQWFESWTGQSTCVINNTNPLVINWRRKQLPRSHYKAIALLRQPDNASLKASHTCFKRLPNPVGLSRNISVNENKVIITDSVNSLGNNTYEAVFHLGSNRLKLLDNEIIISDLKMGNTFCFKFPGNIDIKQTPSPYALSYGEKGSGISIMITGNVNQKEVFTYKIEKL
jgi:Heparinase II/III-like protein/Heparinase II/III N-terminus